MTKFSVIMILLAVAALAHVTAAKTSASIDRIYSGTQRQAERFLLTPLCQATANG